MSLTQGLHRSLQRCPGATALVGRHHELTFADLTDRVSRLAGGLGELGARPGDRIGMLAPNCAEYVEYALACPWGGFVAAPLNTRWSLEEMLFQIDDAGIRVLVADAGSVPRARELQARRPGLTTVVTVAGGVAGTPDVPGTVGYETLLAGAEPIEDRRPRTDSLACLLYTGGTTGRPKGVMVSAGGLIASSLGTLAGNGQRNDPERFLHVSPLYHLAALGSLYQQVTLGSTHLTVERFDVEQVAATIERERITATTLVPTMIGRLLEHVERTGADLTSLVRLGYGASTIDESLLRRLLARYPDLELCQRYGMTELCPVATVLTPADHRMAQTRPDRLRSAGRAARHCEVRVVDAEDRDVPLGDVGEIVATGPNLMLGYWNQPDATAEALRGGWMHTGDVGYLDDEGYLYVVDRLKDMIVSGGENVYSAEVERVLALHPGVAACAVIGVPDLDWGERVHAVVVPVAGEELTVEGLRGFCAGHIAGYKAPRSLDVVDELPLSPVGKILKRRLRERYGAGPQKPSLRS